MTARPTASRRRRISPGLVFLAVALILSVGYLAYALTVREASQIPMLAAGAVVVAIAFGALALYCLRAIWRARSTSGGRTLLVGLIGGFAAIASAGAFAGAVILFRLFDATP